MNIDDAVKEAAPHGVDVFFDNVILVFDVLFQFNLFKLFDQVGGRFYNAIISNHVKPNGRVCICGSIENYNAGGEKGISINKMRVSYIYTVDFII